MFAACWGPSYVLRFCSTCLSGLVLLVLLAPGAWADEELFILDNGSVLRGSVLKEDESTLTIEMSGLIGQTLVKVERTAIVERHLVRSDEPRSFVVETAEAFEPKLEPVETPVSVQPGRDWLGDERLPVGDPTPESETFMTRFLRLAHVAVPDTPDAKLTLAFFMTIVVVILVSWGSKLADIANPSLLNASVLAVLFTATFGADLFYSDELLRADRAVWIVPAQILIWVGAARGLLGGTVARAVLLFTFILTSLLAVLFATGAVLVTV